MFSYTHRHGEGFKCLLLFYFFRTVLLLQLQLPSTADFYGYGSLKSSLDKLNRLRVRLRLWLHSRSPLYVHWRGFLGAAAKIYCAAVPCCVSAQTQTKTSPSGLHVLLPGTSPARPACSLGRRWHCVFAGRVEINSKIIG